MELAGIVAGKVLKQSKTGVRTYLMVKTEKWQFSGGQSETLPAKGYVLCAVESGMGKTVAGQTERNISGRQGTSSQDGLPSIGSRVRISGSFSLYTEATNIGQFDARNYYAARKIYGQVKKAAIVYTEPPNIIGRGKECLWQLRRHLAETFLEVYGEENGALLAAMLLGERTFLSEETQSLYKAAGTLHVIAVSGLHISLLGLGLYRLLRRIFDAQAPAAVISVLCMAAYVFLVGNPPSAVRAFIMFAMGLLAGYWKRTLDTPTALSLSAAIILMGNPFYIGQSSFLLSFLAILAIAVFQPALKECLALINPYHFPLSRLLDSRRAWRLRHLDPQKVTGGCHELLKKAGNGLQSSFSVWIVTLPVQLFFFSEVSLFGIFFNPLIIPLMGVILLLGIAGLFLKEIFHLFTFLTGSALTDWEITVISICRYAEGIFFAIIKAVAFAEVHATLSANDGPKGPSSQMMKNPEENFVGEVSYGIGRPAMNQGYNAKFSFQIEEEVEPTLVASGASGVAHPRFSSSKASFFTEANEECANTLVATDYKDPPIVNDGDEVDYIVRRLTPTECARLQGFPDWWCDDLGIPDPTDEDIAKWREVFETHAKAIGKTTKPKSDAQIRKWLQNPQSDSAEYKMWGNGVALPNVFFVLAGIKYYSDLSQK